MYSCSYYRNIVYGNISKNNKVSSIKSSEIHQRKLYDLQRGSRGRKKDTKLKNKLEEQIRSILKEDLNTENLLKYLSSDKENIKDKVINYNDLTNHLNRKELLAILETINEKTPRNNLINIWCHVVGINRGEIDEFIDKLTAYTEYYMNNYNKHHININEIKKF
ncbi:Plasmodium exported protein (PHISTa), unknown, putative [Plasmodium sp. gorilla clade G3]|nr:Plasmodium exported protein (PHISTa), unknown, putative [Plasmodium sp. gorilla clade G3]